MDRGMQAVPVLVEGGSQTQLTHPKNVYIQYVSIIPYHTIPNHTIAYQTIPYHTIPSDT